MANLQLTSSTTGALEPAVGVGPDGLARVVWTELSDGLYRIYWAAYSSNGQAQIGPIEISNSTSHCRYPRVDVDDANRSFVAWLESGSIHFARVDADGEIGVTNTTINAGAGAYEAPDIVVTASGTSHITAALTYATFRRVVYAAVDQDGNVTHYRTPGDNDIFGIGPKAPCITIEPDGTIMICWYDYAGFFSEGLYAARYNSAGSALYNGRIKNGSDIRHPTVFVSSAGLYWVFYENQLSNVDRIYIWEGSDSQTLVSPAPGPTRRPRVASGDGQRVFCVWEDHSTTPVRVRAGDWALAGSYDDDDVAVSESTGAATLPAIDSTGDGRCCVVWQDMRQGNAQIYMNWLPLVGVDVEVRSETTDQLLPGAEVALLVNGRVVANGVTDLDGHYRFAGLDPGAYSLHAAFSGHQCHDVVPVTVPESGFTPATIKVPTDTEIVGTILDAFNEQPLPGLEVRLDRNGTELATATTGSHGQFLFNVIDGGSYEYSALSMGQVTSAGVSDTLYAGEHPQTLSVTLGQDLATFDSLDLESRVVVLVHGIRSSHQKWANSGLANRLTTAGWTCVDDIDLPGHLPLVNIHGLAGIDEQAEYLAKRLELLDVQSYNVVAHSQGGLVTRYMNEYIHDGAERVNRLITLATPHHGSPLSTNLAQAISFFGETIPNVWYRLIYQVIWNRLLNTYQSITDLMPDSDFQRRLNRGSKDVEDWSGNCLGADPEPEVSVTARANYLTIIGDEPSGVLEVSNTIMWLDGCFANDGVVPVVSGRLYADKTNLRNYLASNFGVDAHHKEVTGIVESVAIQDSVLQWLDRDPETWPPSHDLKEWDGGKDTNQWDRLSMIQVQAEVGVDHEDSLLVDVCDSLAVTWAWFDGQVGLELRSPSGVVVDSVVAASDPTITYLRDLDNKEARFVLATPEPGQWSFITTDVQAVYEQDALIWLDAVGVPDLEIFLDPETSSPYSDRILTANLVDSDQLPILGATLACTVTGPSEASHELELRDDGIAPDPVAGDGNYSARVTVEINPGSTTIDVRTVADGSLDFERSVTSNINIGALTDLAVEEPGLLLQSETGLAGCPVEISASIMNFGILDSEVVVEIRRGSATVPLFADTLFLNVGSSAQIQATDLPTRAGDYAYQVQVRPLGGLGEADWQDNSAAAQIIISPPVTDPLSSVEDNPTEGREQLQGRPAAILRCYPNPFNPTVTIECSLKRSGTIGLKIFNIRGQLVRTIQTAELPQGVHSIKWDGRTTAGSPVSSGVYMVDMQAVGTRDRYKVMLLK